MSAVFSILEIIDELTAAYFSLEASFVVSPLPAEIKCTKVYCCLGTCCMEMVPDYSSFVCLFSFRHMKPVLKESKALKT